MDSDGIDGTAVVVQGDNRWQSLIALEQDGQLIVSTAVVPAQGQHWWAVREGGEGRYHFALPEAIAQGGFRPLRDPTAAVDDFDHGFLEL